MVSRDFALWIFALWIKDRRPSRSTIHDQRTARQIYSARPQLHVIRLDVSEGTPAKEDLMMRTWKSA